MMKPQQIISASLIFIKVFKEKKIWDLNNFVEVVMWKCHFRDVLNVGMLPTWIKNWNKIILIPTLYFVFQMMECCIPVWIWWGGGCWNTVYRVNIIIKVQQINKLFYNKCHKVYMYVCVCVLCKYSCIRAVVVGSHGVICLPLLWNVCVWTHKQEMIMCIKNHLERHSYILKFFLKQRQQQSTFITTFTTVVSV